MDIDALVITETWLTGIVLGNFQDVFTLLLPTVDIL